MDIFGIMKEATHYTRHETSGMLSFYDEYPCEECGAKVYTNGSPWFGLANMSADEFEALAIGTFNLKDIGTQYPNEGYYSEHTESNECCGECAHLVEEDD